MSRRHHRQVFFNDTATTEIYTLSLHDALPILPEPAHRQPSRRRSKTKCPSSGGRPEATSAMPFRRASRTQPRRGSRSGEHTSELQSRRYLVCRLLLEKTYKELTSTSLRSLSST